MGGTELSQRRSPERNVPGNNLSDHANGLVNAQRHGVGINLCGSSFICADYSAWANKKLVFCVRGESSYVTISPSLPGKIAEMIDTQRQVCRHSFSNCFAVIYFGVARRSGACKRQVLTCPARCNFTNIIIETRIYKICVPNNFPRHTCRFHGRKPFQVCFHDIGDFQQYAAPTTRCKRF